MESYFERYSQKIATAIWRSGYIKDRNKVRQRSKVEMQRLIVSNIASELKEENPNFDTEKFEIDCGLSLMKF